MPESLTGPSITIDTTDAFRMGAIFEALGISTRTALRAVVRKWGLLGLAKVKANASGRPGPRFRTGDYRRTWNARFDADGLMVSIGTNAVQARRLEYGFVGADSLGRIYNQPPYPHVRRAAEEIAEPFQLEVLLVIQETTP